MTKRATITDYIPTHGTLRRLSLVATTAFHFGAMILVLLFVFETPLLLFMFNLVFLGCVQHCLAFISLRKTETVALLIFVLACEYDV